jgi:hypothetical protein
VSVEEETRLLNFNDCSSVLCVALHLHLVRAGLNRHEFKNVLSTVGTVNASNFGPHVNFGFFPEVLAIIKTRPTEELRK